MQRSAVVAGAQLPEEVVKRHQGRDRLPTRPCAGTDGGCIIGGGTRSLMPGARIGAMALRRDALSYFAPAL
jgi:hypothetical protein